MKLVGYVAALLLVSAIVRAQAPISRSNADAQAKAQATRLGEERSAEGLETILRAKDLVLLRAYARAFHETSLRLYIEQKKTGPLPDDVEALMVRYYADPLVGGALRTLCTTTSTHSRSRALFDLLFAEWRSGKVRPEEYTMRNCALQTEAAGVEPPLLAWLVAPDPPKEEDKWRIFEFLGKRKYAPAVPVLAAQLRKADDVGATGALALLSIGTPDAIDAFTDRLAALRRELPGSRRTDEIASIVRRLAALPATVALPYARLRAALPEDVRELAIPWLRERKDLAAVPDALGLLPGTMTFSRAIEALVATDSPDVWKKARAEIEQLQRQNRLSEGYYRHTAAMLDDKIANPEKHFAEKRYQQQEPQLRARRNALVKANEATRKLRDSDPDRYVAGMRDYLAGLEKLAREYEKQPGALAARGDIGSGYMDLGHFVRFNRKRPKDALELYAAGERNGARLGNVAVADTLQFDLRDSKRAIEEYRKLSTDLAAAPKEPRTTPREDSMTLWARSWLAAQMQYLESGKPFSGEVGPGDIEVAAMVIQSGGGGEQDTFNLVAFRSVVKPSGWPTGKRPVVKHRDVARILDSLPASSFVLLHTLDLLGWMPDARSILAFLARHDPAGFVSASYFGAVDLAARDRDGSLATQLFGPAVRGGSANPLIEAKSRFMRERRITVRPARKP